MHNLSSASFRAVLFVAGSILVFAAKAVFCVPAPAGDRDVAMQAQKMLSQAVVQEDKKMDDQLQQSNQQLTTAIRQRFADVAAFGYSLMSVYTLHSGSLPSRGLLQQNDTAMPNFMAQMSSIVPELFKTYFGPPTGAGDAPSQAEKEDLQCVNACIAGLEQKMMQRMNGPEAILLDNNSGLPGMATAALNTFGRLNCSDEMEGRACVANCSQRHSAAPFSSFLLSQLDWFLARHCAHPEDQLDVLALLDSCRLAQIPQLAFSFTFEFGNKFAGSFNQANGDQQRCSVVKKTLVDDFSHSISAICEQPTQSQLLDRMLHTTAGYALAQNTEGAIFSRCPDIYSTNR